MKLQANDKSYQALTVGSLNVLGSISGSAMQSIHTHLQTTQAANAKIQADMERLYQSVSSDGLISAHEKLLLKKELTIIETEYPVIVHKAEQGKKKAVDIRAFKNSYAALIRYIYTDIRLFDDMYSAVEVDRDSFNAVFAAYYKALAVLQINKDGSDSITSLPQKNRAAAYLNFDESVRYVPKAQPSYTAWQSRIIEYDCTDKHEITMTFAEALNNVIILTGTLQNDVTLRLFFDPLNSNGAKQYQVVYRLVGTGMVTIKSTKEGTQTVTQKIADYTYGTGCYIIVDKHANVWAFSGKLKEEDFRRAIDTAAENAATIVQNITNEYTNKIHTFVGNKKTDFEALVQSKIDEINNTARDRFVKESGQIGEVRYFVSKNYTYGFLYANGYAFIPELYPEYYRFWLENFGDSAKKNYLGYDCFGYPKLPDLRGVSLRAVDDRVKSYAVYPFIKVI